MYDVFVALIHCVSVLISQNITHYNEQFPRITVSFLISQNINNYNEQFPRITVSF